MDNKFTEQEEAVIAAFFDEVCKTFSEAAERHNIASLLSRLDVTESSEGFCGSISIPFDFPDSDKFVTLSLRPKFSISRTSEVAAFAAEHVGPSGPVSELEEVPPRVQEALDRHFRVDALKKEYVASLTP